MQGAPHTHTHTHTIGAVKRKGFTIIQLVIGMLIFAILTGIAFFGISVYTAQANETRVASDLGTFEVAIKDYMLNNPGACSDGTLSPVGLNHYLTKENTLALDEADPNKDDLGSEISVAAGVKGEVAYKKLSVLEDPWGHRYRVVIRNNADRTTEEGEYGAKGTDRAFIYVYSMGKDGKGAANDTKQDDSVLCVQYSDGEVYSRAYLPSDGKNQAITAPAYTYWNKDENGKHSVMKDSIFAVGTVDPSKAPGKENGSSGGIGGGGSNVTSSYAGWYVTGDYAYMRTPTAGNELGFTSIEEGKRFIKEVYIKVATGMTWGEFVRATLSDPDNEGLTEEQLASAIYADVGLDESTFVPATLSDEWTVMVVDKEKTSYGALEAIINGYPVTSLAETFKGCTNMKKAPSIPTSVKNMTSTFEGCASLTGTITLDCKITSLDGCFKDTVKPIVLSGESPNLYDLAATGNNGNVTVAKPTKPSKSMQWGYNVLDGNNVEIRTRTVADVSDEELSAAARKMAEENNQTEYFNGDYSVQNILKVYFELNGGQASDAPKPGDTMYDFFVEGLKTSYCTPMKPKGDLVIPSRLNEDGYYDKNGKYAVTGIAEEAFDNNKDITYVALPDTLTTIGKHAFYYCSNLSEIAFGQNITTIREYAFSQSGLQGDLEIPKSVKNVEQYAFSWCTKLTSVETGSGMTSVSEGMFSNCAGIKSIKIGSNIASVGNDAFNGCSGITEIVIPNSVTSIGYDAFSGCRNLADIVLPDNLTEIGSSAFSGCGITDISYIPAGITKTWRSAFSYCSKLVNVTIPGKIKTIGDDAFWACENLESVIIQDGVETIGRDAFRCCEKLKSVTIPCSVTSMDDFAFLSCTNLTEINYLGTMSQWNSIIRYRNWDQDTGDYIVKCTDGTISKNS